jgi:hypothetical protein
LINFVKINSTVNYLISKLDKILNKSNFLGAEELSSNS